MIPMNRQRRRTALAAIGISLVAFATTSATATPPSAPATKCGVMVYQGYFVTGANETELEQHNQAALQAALHAGNPAAVPGVLPGGKVTRVNTCGG